MARPCIIPRGLMALLIVVGLTTHAWRGTAIPEDTWEFALVGGASWLIEGRVVMRVNSTSEWGYVCSDLFKDTSYAPIATCHSIGLLGVQDAAFVPMPLDVLDHPILLDDVLCTANDTFVQNCSHNPVGVHNCDGGREVSGVKCSIPPTMWEFRLVGGTTPTNGRVEMRPLPTLAWGSIYNGIFLQGGSYTISAVRAMCKTLGFNASVTPPVVIDVPYVSSGPSYLYPRYCYESDAYVQTCTAYDLTRYSWGASSQLAIECDPTWELRIVGGPNAWEGRVEARISSAANFSRVCAGGVDTDALYTVCQQAGFTNATYGRQMPFGTYGIDNASEFSSMYILNDLRCSNAAVTNEVQNCRFGPLWGGTCGANQLNIRCPPFTPAKWQFRLTTTTVWTQGYLEVNYNAAVGEPWDRVGYCLSPLEVQQACRIVNRTGWGYPPTVSGIYTGAALALGSPTCPTSSNSTFQDCRVPKGTYLRNTGSSCNSYAAFLDCNPPNPYVDFPQRWQFRLLSNASYLENATLVNSTYMENGTWTSESWTPGTYAAGVCINGTWSETINCTGVVVDSTVVAQFPIAGAWVGGDLQTNSVASGVCSGGSWIEGSCSGTWEASTTASPTCSGGVWINATMCTGIIVPGAVSSTSPMDGICVDGSTLGGTCSGSWVPSAVVNKSWRPCHKANYTTVNTSLIDGVCVEGEWVDGNCTGVWMTNFTTPDHCTDNETIDGNGTCTNGTTVPGLFSNNSTVDGVCVGGLWRRGKCAGVWVPSVETDIVWEPTCSVVHTYSVNSTVPGECINGTFAGGVCGGTWQANATYETQVDGACMNGSWVNGACTGVWVSQFVSTEDRPCSLATYATVSTSVVPGICVGGTWSDGVCSGTWNPTYTVADSCSDGTAPNPNGTCTSGTYTPGFTVSTSTIVGVCSRGSWSHGTCTGTWKPRIKVNTTFTPDCNTTETSSSTSRVSGSCVNGTFSNGVCNGTWDDSGLETLVEGVCVNGSWVGGSCTGVWVAHVNILSNCVPPDGEASDLCVDFQPGFNITQNTTLLGPTYIPPAYVNGSAFPPLRSGRVEMRMDIDEPWLRVADTSNTIARRLLCDALNFTDVKYSAYVTPLTYGTGTGNFSLTGVSCSSGNPYIAGGVRWCPHNEPPVWDGAFNDLQLECIPYNPSYRLVNGTLYSNGRFQMKPYDSAEWGGVCQYGFDQNAAVAACHQIGWRNYSKVPEYRPWDLAGYTDWMNYPGCSGVDAFVNCTIPNSIGNLYNSCGESVGVECNATQLYPNLFEYRLVNGSSARNGRVEMRYNDSYPWQRVCYSSAYYARLAACWSVGFTDTPWTASVAAGTYGPGDPEVWWAATGLGCSSSTSYLSQCSLEKPIYTYTCQDDLVVNCPAYQPEYRLIPYERPDAGRLEFRPYPTAPWGNIDENAFGADEVAVACRHFGFNVSREPQQVFRMTAPTQTTYLYSLHCNPNGTHLISDCTLPARLSDTRTSSASYYSLGLDCNPMRWRITGGPTFGRGRIEFRPQVNQPWGTVCNDGFKTSHTAWLAACHSAGYLNATNAKPEWYGEGTGTIYIDDLSCPYGVFYIEYCSHSPLGVTNCGHNEDAGVDCFAAEDNKAQWEYRLNGGTSPSNGRLEIRPDATSPWGTVCQDSFNYSFPTWLAVCNTVGFPTERAEFQRYSSNGGVVYLDHFDCPQGVDHLANCTSFPLGSYGCSENQMAGVDCNPPNITDDEYEFRFKPDADPNSTQTGGLLQMRPGADREWGTVCPGNVTITQEVLVAICNTLGIPYTTPVLARNFGNGSGYIYLSEPTCTSSSPTATLENCSFAPLYDNECDHSDDISVECIPATCPPSMDYDLILGGGRSVFNTLEISEAEVHAGGEYVVDTSKMLLNVTFMPGVYSYVAGFIATLPPGPVPNTTAPTDPNATTTTQPKTYPTLPPKTSPTTSTLPTSPTTTALDPSATTTAAPNPWEGLSGLVVVPSETILNTIRGNYDSFLRLGVPTNFTLTILSNRSARVSFTGIPGYKAATTGELAVFAIGATLFDGLCAGSANSPDGVLMMRVVVRQSTEQVLKNINDANTVIAIANAVVEMASIGGGAAADIQVLSALAMLSCADPRNRAAFSSIRALSPAAVEDSYIGAVIGNLILTAAVLVLHLTVLIIVRRCNKTRRWVTVLAMCRFPVITLNAVVALYTGTLFASAQVIVLNENSPISMAVGYLAFVVSLLAPLVFVVFAYFFIERAYLLFETEEWLMAHPWIRKLWLVIPEGTINAPETRRAFGSLISYRLADHLWLTLPFWTSLVVGLLALIQPDTIAQCQALFSIAGLVFLAMAGVVLWKRPYRTHLGNGLYGVGKALIAVLLFLMAGAVTDDASGERAATGAIVIGVMIFMSTCVRMVLALVSFALDHKMNAEKLPLTTMWTHLVGQAQRSTLQFDIASDELKDIEATSKKEERAGEDDHTTLLIPKLEVEQGMIEGLDMGDAKPNDVDTPKPHSPLPPPQASTSLAVSNSSDESDLFSDSASSSSDGNPTRPPTGTNEEQITPAAETPFAPLPRREEKESPSSSSGSFLSQSSSSSVASQDKSPNKSPGAEVAGNGTRSGKSSNASFSDKSSFSDDVL